MKLNICHLYPDIMNLYGDAGNLVCLKQRLAWRGIDCEVTTLPIGETADFTKFDMFFIGGGQDFEQDALRLDLASGKAKEIISAVEDEAVFLCIDGGYQIMGEYFKTPDGRQLDFIGALKLHTLGCDSRMIGNCMFACDQISGGSTVVGFENHGGKTYLGQGLTPLGKVLSGFGNNGEDGGEGVRYKNVFGTYCHGPLLPKNPGLADHILTAALLRRNPQACLEPLNDELEIRAHDYMENRLKS